jgi:hypothetical protein
MRSLRDVLFDRREREIAHGCALTVITEPQYLGSDDLIPACLELMYPEIWKRKKKKTRYDLLSLPDMTAAAEDSLSFDLLVEDLRTAISLHQAEYAAIISDSPARASLAERLMQHPQLQNIQVRHYWSKASLAATECLAVTCMDWRLHGTGGFAPLLRAAFREPTANVMTIPGVAKDLTAQSPRGRAVLTQLDRLASDGLRKLILAAHTDCGKYGGHGAFDGDLEETGKLTCDMRAAADLIQRHCGLEVSLALAEIGKDKVSRLSRIPRCSPFSFSIRIGSSDDDD